MAHNFLNAKKIIILVLSVVAVSATVRSQEPDSVPVTETATGEDSTTATSDQSELIRQCQGYAQTLMLEKQRLREELDAIKARIEAAALQDMEEDEEEDDSNESHSRSRGIRGSRGKRGTSVCEGGTVSQWACGPQCIFKLKGLCGLSLRAMCHC